MTTLTTPEAVRLAVHTAVADTPITDLHTHLFSPRFGDLLLWGIDELLTYHYLVAETFRWIDLSYDAFWALTKREQADLIWQTLFIEHSPISEACRGVLTALSMLGLDPSARDLAAVRRFCDGFSVEQYVDRVFSLANVTEVVMTNDPFDDLERPLWEQGGPIDPRFHAALRIDGLLNSWETAVPRLRGWGYTVEEALTPTTRDEVRRFLRDWIGRQGALYLAVSLPPTFRLPATSVRATLITECVLPVCQELDKPFALMIGVKKLVNPALKLAGDSVGKSDIETVEHLCATYPHNKFLITMLARENTHELCVVARKFRNLLVFGCWWFLNNPSLIEEMTRMRLELLGTSVVPQHSDARVLDQLLYKWTHSRAILGDVIADKFVDALAAGWQPTEAEIRRDVGDLLGGTFWKFLAKPLG
jgi:hypothetical protein